MCNKPLNPNEVDRMYLEWIYYGSDTDRCPCGVDHEQQKPVAPPVRPSFVSRVLKVLRVN